MAAGEVIIQSMWSPAVAAVRVKEIPCIYAPVNVKNGKEGYRGWCNGMALMKHLSGKKLDAAYEYLNWYLMDGRAPSSAATATTARRLRPPRSS